LGFRVFSFFSAVCDIKNFFNYFFLLMKNLMEFSFAIFSVFLDFITRKKFSFTFFWVLRVAFFTKNSATSIGVYV